MKTAIAMCLYRRPAYTKQVLDALLECYNIDDVPVYLSQDWSFEHNEACEEVKQLAIEFQRKHRGPSQYFVNAPKLGVDLNKLSVIPKAFNDGADFVIFLEDVHLPSRDAVRWFIEMGERFRHDERIGFIGGYSRQTRLEFQYSTPDEIRFSGINDGRAGFDPHSFATWRDRWDYFLSNDGEDYKRICGGEGLFDHYMHLRHGEVLSKHSVLGTVGMDKPLWPGIVSPKIARIQLIGWEDATHTPSREWFMENEFNEFWMGSYEKN